MNRIILIAEGPTAATAMESLAGSFEVCAVFRSCLDAKDPVTACTAAYSIPLIHETKMARIQSEICRLHPACVVVSSYHRLIPPEVLKLCPFINVHYGPLPRYRGRANVNWAILNHEPEAAITIHTIDPGLDSGNVLFQRLIPIGPHSTVTEVYERLNQIQREELGKTVIRRLSGYAGLPQQGPATYCCARVPEDGEVNWAASTRDAYALIRSLAPPYPGAYTFFQMRKVIVAKAAPVAHAPEYVGLIPGRVISVQSDIGAIDILTGDGVLRVYEFEDEAGMRMRATDLVRSTRDTLGLTARDLLRRIQELEHALAAVQQEREPQLVSQTTA